MWFASGKYAKGICDLCGLTWKLKELKKLTGLQPYAGMLVCPDCWTPDHPQLHVERIPPPDREALRNPRPDNRDAQLAITWGWNPVPGLEAKCSIGTVS